MAVSIIVLLLAIYHETVSSMVKIWLNSDAFAHCFLIFPISGYLIWRRRAVLSQLVPQTDFRPLAIVGLLGFTWLLGGLGDVMALQHFSLVAMIPMLVWALLGGNVAREIAFPLAFLLFSVPFGEFLLPRMLEFTADFTVGMLHLTGIPVYREGNYFSIPSGDWSVVEACAGLRFLIASVTLGALFAYLNYQSTVRRAIFILASIVVPVILNGLRAYLIVMIGHLSNMTLGVGVDHFVYGWVFFGMGMALLFWVGGKWSDVDDMQPVSRRATRVRPGWKAKRMLLLGVGALMIAAIWPIRAAQIEESSNASMAPIRLVLPEPNTAWRQGEPMTTWTPRYQTAELQAQRFYTDGQHTVAMFIEYYRLEKQGRELINSQNILVHQNDPNWKMPAEGTSVIRMNGHDAEVLQGRLQSKQQELLTWRWNWVSGEFTVNDYLAKILQARDKLLGRTTDSAGIVLSVEVKHGLPAARAALQSFVDVMLASIEQTLENAAKERTSPNDHGLAGKL